MRDKNAQRAMANMLVYVLCCDWLYDIVHEWGEIEEGTGNRVYELFYILMLSDEDESNSDDMYRSWVYLKLGDGSKINVFDGSALKGPGTFVCLENDDNDWLSKIRDMYLDVAKEHYIDRRC